MVSYFLDQASSYAASIDNLIMLITVLVGFWFLVAEGALIYFIIRFRRKDGVKAKYITGTKKREKKWIDIPHKIILVCDVIIIVGAIMVWYDIKQDLPEPDATVRIIGQQWTWTFVHPGPDGKLDTADDITTTDELHVQVDTLYHFQLEAKDVLHCFSVPVFRLKQDAVPGRRITGWFEPIMTGGYDVQCAEICGIGHGIMVGKIVIESKEEHAAWISKHDTGVTEVAQATRQ